LIYNGIRQPLRAYQDLFISILLWPWFLNPASNGDRFLFRLRACVRYALHALKGPPAP